MAAIAYFLFVLVFLTTLIPEQVLRYSLIAQIRTVLRFGLIWSGCLIVLVNLHRVGDRLDSSSSSTTACFPSLWSPTHRLRTNQLRLWFSSFAYLFTVVLKRPQNGPL